MWDFDWSNLPPIHHNWKPENDPSAERNGISAKPNKYYDLGFFITSLYFLLVDNEIKFTADLNDFFQNYAVSPEDRASYEDNGMIINTLRPSSYVTEIATANEVLNNKIFDDYKMTDIQLAELENKERVIAKYIVY